MNASVRLDHTLLAVDGEHDVHAMLELAAPEPPGDAARPPLRLALVLDRSGSMAGAKLETAKRCAAWLLGRLRATDELALVDYDDEVRLLAPLGPVRERELRAAVAGIASGGQTNLSGGWLKGLEELRRAPVGTPRKILLLTDGLANVGITQPERLVDLAAGAYRDGIGTATIGFGDGFDEDLLTRMATAGGGSAHYAETPDAAPAIFAAELSDLTRLVAQNVSVELRPAPEVELLAVLNDYPAVPVPGGVQVELGDVYAGERRRVVFALHLPHLAAHGPARVAEAVVRYVSVGEEIAAHTLRVPVAANLVSAGEAAAAQPDLEVAEEVLVLEAARARSEAIALADRGEHETARTVLERAAADLRHSTLASAPAQAAAVEAEARALDEERGLLAPAAWSAAHRKRLVYEAYNRQQGKHRRHGGRP